jgi:hypothetical protein
VYHVRGNVRFTNGTVDLQPGTSFIVEGLNGQNIPTTTYPDNTVIEVENANLELTGAGISSSCSRAWGGIRLLGYGRIHTRANAAVTAAAGRSFIRDAWIGVHVVAPDNGRSTGEYYLNDTDFVNNDTGVFDYYKTVARAGEGIHRCTFSTDANIKTPLVGGYSTGVRLSWADQSLGYNPIGRAVGPARSFRRGCPTTGSRLGHGLGAGGLPGGPALRPNVPVPVSHSKVCPSTSQTR